jgi:hypothetical protein
MEGFKKNPKIACFKEGGQVKYESRKEHKEEMAADVEQDKAMVKKGVAQHESKLHKGEPKTELKLKTGGRAKKEKGTVKKYKAGGSIQDLCGGKAVKKAEGGIIDTIKGVGKRLYENVMGTDKQNAEAQARMDAAKAKEAAAPSAPVAKKRGGKC